MQPKKKGLNFQKKNILLNNFDVTKTKSIFVKFKDNKND